MNSPKEYFDEWRSANRTMLANRSWEEAMFTAFLLGARWHSQGGTLQFGDHGLPDLGRVPEATTAEP